MHTHQVTLEADDLQKLNSVEKSIIGWSVDIGKLSCQLQQANRQLQELYDARKKMLLAVASSMGLDLNKIVEIECDSTTGVISINIDSNSNEA